MYYIFNKKGECIANSDFEPDEIDLSSRQEFAIESTLNFINPYFNGKEIVEQPLPPTKWHKWNGSTWVIDETKQAEINAQTLHQLTESIDNKATTIYTTWTRFESEYKARQAAAEVFKAANYQGEPSIYITSFAVPAGVDNKTATEIILQQAAGLQKLQDHLAALRMRKYELKHPDLTTAQMQAIHDDIIKQMDDLMEAYQNG